MTLPSGTVRPTYFQVATPFDHGLETENRIISILVPTCECFPSAETLRAVFGLTRSEALVAAGISHGLSLREISDELSLSIETTRTYSKRIYSKLGISRQSELVSQVLRVTLPEQSPRC
ncbi:helix-turn-helix transcriptional regulator [Poseidonocella sp. HB161398]|uniref:helix-turn-helix transcriptional regulator n=1 Tax=Poseidonocella sp. HB161398 TaxID=2320855 RepID=UPI00110904E2